MILKSYFCGFKSAAISNQKLQLDEQLWGCGQNGGINCQSQNDMRAFLDNNQIQDKIYTQSDKYSLIKLIASLFHFSAVQPV